MRTAFAGLLATLVFALPAAAAEHGPEIVVTGQGTARLAPDIAVLELGVELRAETAEAALDRAAETTGALLAALAEDGVPAEDIQTRRIGLRPIFDTPSDPGAALPPAGFAADSLLSVTLRDPARLGTIYGAAAEAGATRFDGLRFENADPAAALTEARAAAVADARRRAETYAEAAGLGLGAVLRIVEAGSRPGPMPMRDLASEAMSMTAMPVAPGTLEVSAQVTVVYALEP